jgi:hypothetical protein
LELCSDLFKQWLCWPGGLNKDTTVWQHGDKPPDYQIISLCQTQNLMISVNIKSTFLQKGLIRVGEKQDRNN